MKGNKMLAIPTSSSDLVKSAIECLANARRLIRQANSLNDELDGAPTAYALAILAQEEIVKGFLLYLVCHEALPWNTLVHRSLRDHACKQLWFVVLEALVADEETCGASPSNSRDIDEDGRLLSKVADVLNWYRYAKIETWNQGYCDWDEEPEEDHVREIIGGKLDRRKQNALYVGIGGTGKVTSSPEAVTANDANHAIETAERFHSYANDLIGIPGGHAWRQVDWLKGLLAAIFTPPVRTGREIRDYIPGIVIYEESRVVLQAPKITRAS